MSNLGQMALSGRSYGPSKCKLALENGLCSDVPSIIGQKLQHLFSRAFLAIAVLKSAVE